MTPPSEVPPALRQLARLLKQWGPLPDLPGAACRGRAPEFDDLLPGECREDQTARHDTALALCRSCPALDGCRDELDAHGPGPGVGVQAGRVLAAPAHRTRTGRAA